MKRLALLVALAVLVPVSSWAQVVSGMTPERIAEAIKAGEAAKDRDKPGYYRIQLRSGWGNGPLIGFFSTPFSRVMAAANAAKRKYKSLSPAEVTGEMIAPEIVVYAPSAVEETGTGLAAKQKIVSVEAVVVPPMGSKDRSKAIHPIRTSEMTEEYQNLFGAKSSGKGMIAVFPLSVLTEENEIHIVFDALRTGQGILHMCTDCAVQFKLDKIR